MSGAQPTLEWSTLKVIRSGRLQPYSQTLKTTLTQLLILTNFVLNLINLDPYA